MRTLLFLLLIAGCASAARLSRAEFVGTTWREVCPDPTIATAYVRLDDDGFAAWSYTHPDSVRADTMHTWAVEGDALVLRWNLGHATSRYRRAGGRFVADSSTFCVDVPPELDRVR